MFPHLQLQVDARDGWAGHQGWLPFNVHHVFPHSSQPETVVLTPKTSNCDPYQWSMRPNYNHCDTNPTTTFLFLSLPLLKNN
ncbi:hypothetical protein PRUPE_8G050300 [Prunus persica]|uniref:Uncharacterized protein n=1 Tax=Prunus persica TaxID=3760 RepID=A0A251MTD1_PRUPE|nr:hypothetical protein PRUPE_8G050300 [Prunus persica]